MKTRDELIKLTESYVAYRELLSSEQVSMLNDRLTAYVTGTKFLPPLLNDILSTAILNCGSEIIDECMKIISTRFKTTRLELIREEYMPEGTDDIVLGRKP